MRWIVSRSLRFRWLMVFAATAIMVFGVSQVPRAQVDVFPEFAPPRVEIQTIALGNSSNEVEELVTIPIEEQLTGLPGVDELRSKSVAQLSSIELIFGRGTDEVRSRQLVQERIAQVTPTLPSWASPPFMMPPLSATSRILKIGLSSDELTLIEMSNIAYWKIRERLLRVPGVAQVAIWGERLQQRHVQVDPAQLAANRVSLERVMNVTGDALDAGLLRYNEGAVVGTGGFVESGGQRLNIRHVQPVVGPEELAQVPVSRRNGRTLRLSDVARVVEGHLPLWGDANINGGPGLLLIVQKFRGANTMEVTRGVEDAIDEMRPGLPGMEIDTTIFRPATFIEQSIDNLTTAMIVGVLLVTLIIAAFLLEFRTAFISLIAIPLSLTAAVLVLELRDVTINVMVLAGLVVAIGVVVDDAIIDVENIVRRLRQARAAGSSRSTFGIVLDASVEVRSAITYATVINVVAIVPVFFLQGLSGSFFAPLVLSYGLAVLLSMVVALTVTPALCLLLLSRGPLRQRESPLLRVLKRGIRLAARANHPQAQPGGRYGGGPLGSRGGDLPDARKPTASQFQGAGLPDALAHGAVLVRSGGDAHHRSGPVRICWRSRGSATAARTSGRPCWPTRSTASYFGENWISVSDEVDYDDTVASIDRTIQGYPGIFHDRQTYLRERIKEVLTGTSNSIVVRIFGPDLDVLRAKADEISKEIAGIDGVIDAAAELEAELPHIEVEANLAAARRYGLKPGDIRRQSSTLLASEEVSDIFYGGKAYDVQVWSIPRVRDSLTDVEELPIDTPGGDRIRLEQVADVRIAPTRQLDRARVLLPADRRRRERGGA